MKKTSGRTAALVVVIGLACAATAGTWDYLWGRWVGRGDSSTVVTFSPTRITISENNTQEVWQVVAGTNLIAGLTVANADQTNQATAMVKMNEMSFRLGDRIWALRQEGSVMPPASAGGMNAPPADPSKS